MGPIALVQDIKPLDAPEESHEPGHVLPPLPKWPTSQVEALILSTEDCTRLVPFTFLGVSTLLVI